jgi:sugar phosphate permease
MTGVGPPETGERLVPATSVIGQDWRARIPFFYGWVIVAAALLSLGLTYSIWYSFSVFYVALLRDFHWSRASTASIFSTFVIVGGIASPVSGALVDRFGPGRVVAVGGAVLAAGMLICSRLTELWQFYVAFGVVAALGTASTGWTPCVTMITRWFRCRLGIALGIASGGIGVGILVVVPSVQAIIQDIGWRAAYVTLGVTVFLGLVSIGLVLFRGEPGDLGQQIDGRDPSDSPLAKGGKPARRKVLEVVDPEWAGRQWSLSLALRTSRFWFLGIATLIGHIATQMIFVHQVAYLVDAGHDGMVAASIVGLVGFLSVGSKVLWGWSADTIGREMTYALGCASMVLAIALLAMIPTAPTLALLYAYAVLFALGYGISAPLWPIVTADLFTGPHFGAIYGFMPVFGGFGSALGALFAGYIFDLAGSYTIAFAVAAVAMPVSAVALWLVAPRKVRRVRIVA